MTTESAPTAVRPRRRHPASTARAFTVGASATALFSIIGWLGGTAASTATAGTGSVGGQAAIQLATTGAQPRVVVVRRYIHVPAAQAPSTRRATPSPAPPPAPSPPTTTSHGS
jgi:hypothetical protein